MNHKEEIQAKLNDKKAKLEKLEQLATQRDYNDLSPAQEMPKMMSYFIGGLGVVGLIIAAIAAIFAPISIPLLIGAGSFLTVGGVLFAVGQHIERKFYSRKYKLKEDIFVLQREIDALSAELGKEDSNFLTKQEEKVKQEHNNHKTNKRYVKNPFWGENGPQTPGKNGDKKDTFNTREYATEFEVDLSNFYNSLDDLDEESKDKPKTKDGEGKE